jgi:hypothetical protein
MSELELRAGGTDLSQRQRSGVSQGEVADIRSVPEMTATTVMSDVAAVEAWSQLQPSKPIRFCARHIQASPLQPERLQPRKSAQSQLSAAISHSVHAAGTSAIRLSCASKRVAEAVPHGLATTNMPSPLT